MFNLAEDVANRNEAFGNRAGEFDKQLEINMLTEEFAETMNAMSNGDVVETVDGILDFLVVGLGTMYKIGLTPAQIDRAWHEIMNSNRSKLPVTKNAQGKIQKSENFKKPDLSFLVS